MVMAAAGAVLHAHDDAMVMGHDDGDAHARLHHRRHRGDVHSSTHGRCHPRHGRDGDDSWSHRDRALVLIVIVMDVL